MTQTVLILGARGRFGRHAAQAFAQAGWQVRRFDRARDDLHAEVRGADVVVNGWNPRDYSKWAAELLPMHQRVLDALRGHSATVILPGNVYVYGDQTGTPLGPETPHRPVNELGQMRVELESAYRASGPQVIVLRSGDYLDTQPTLSMFDKIMVSSARRGKFVSPGDPDATHAWAFLPDVARAAALLAGRRQVLPQYCDICFPGYTLTGRQMAAHVGAALGRDLTVRRMAWWPLRVAGIASPMLRMLCKMQYLWNTPHQLDGTAFQAVLPGFQHTPPAEALGQSVQYLQPTDASAAAQPA